MANGKWVTASPGYIHSSTDLTNWVASAQLPTIPYVLTWGGTRDWAFGYAGRVANSTDAVNWTQLPNKNLALLASSSVIAAGCRCQSGDWAEGQTVPHARTAGRGR